MTPANPIKPDLRSLHESELIEFCLAHNQPKFRAGQILDWLYKKRVSAIEEMTNLSQEFRKLLTEKYDLKTPAIESTHGSTDTTQKYLLKLSDGQLVETVLIRASVGLYGTRSDRHTLCVSSQVGCAYGCKFCASGLDGFRRNLTPDEIVNQFILVEKESGQKVNNMVFMGMGEPLANYKNVLRAIQILNAPWGLGVGARKITVSTSGLAPQIKQLAGENLQIQLAISLHGARDEIRDKIMPVNRKYPLKELTQACEEYKKIKDRMITFEYILLAGVNDDLKETRFLADLARKAHARINLIPFNEVPETGFKRPSDAQCESFRKELKHLGVNATLRIEKGHDIEAACGQLRLRRLRGTE